MINFGIGKLLFPIGKSTRDYKASYEYFLSENDKIMRKINGRIFCDARGALRIETNLQENGSRQDSIIIYEPDKKLSYLIDPLTKTGISMKNADSQTSLSDAMKRDDLIAEAELLNLRCLIYQSPDSKNKKLWFSEELNEIVRIKIESDGEIEIFSYTEIEFTKAGKKLFELPQDYTIEAID